MKKIILLLLVTLAFTNCMAQESTNAAKMLQDKHKKEEIFSAILKDKELKKDLMKKMMEEDKGSGMMMHMMQTAERDTLTCKMMGSMMMENPHMMDMMMGSMMDKAETDNTTCKKMCTMMMNSDKMNNMMQEMKGQQPENKPKGSNNRRQHLDEKHH